jgi:hypothetical protein
MKNERESFSGEEKEKAKRQKLESSSREDPCSLLGDSESRLIKSTFWNLRSTPGRGKAAL